MNRIASVFTNPKHKALIGYVTVGYPSIEATLKAVPLLSSLGCDMVELGIPFSDPLADGATIQEASHMALKSKVTPQMCLEVAAQLRSELDIPLLLMTYYNPVLALGVERFCHEAAVAGVDGLIIVDMPPEEGDDLDKASQKEDLAPVYLLAPNSTRERILLASQKSRGFIYLVTVTGVTGARNKLPPYLEEFVLRVKKETNTPLCVGFGISSAATAQRAAAVADGIVVGSRLVQFMGKDDWEGFETLVKELRQALDDRDQ